MSVNRTPHPELFFGLVAPVGVDLDMIIEVLTTELILQKYNTSTIHVTQIMQDVPSNIVLKEEPYLDRITTRIDYADEICNRVEREDALAAITITAIQSIREELNKDIAKKTGKKLPTDPKSLQEALQEPIPKQAYVLRQFKRPKEIGLLRQVYGKLFFQISAYSSPAERELLLKKKIKASNFGGLEDSEAECQAIALDTVVFLEPYPKSYARELHSDSIEIEGAEEVSKVKFTPFLGISPLRYRDFFEKGRRKDRDTGKVVRWAAGIGVPIVDIYHPVYINLETLVSNELKKDERLWKKPDATARS